jgi:hypothetical protein
MIRYPLFEETAIQMGSLAGIAANRPNSGARSNEPKRLYQMPYGVVTAVVIGALAWSAGSVLAGTCANDIAQVEAALDALTAAGPGRGAAHQSTDAQLHRQPTRSSVARGREEAIADERHDRAALERARAADNRGDHAACVKALSEARSGISPR